MAEMLGKPFDENTQRETVAAGYKGGQYFENPVTVPDRHFVDAMSTVAQGADRGYEDTIPQPAPLDPWVVRRPNNQMKSGY